MARVEEMVPFIVEFEAGVRAPGKGNEWLWETARKSGFADDPDDAGGATMVGVTIATYTQYRKAKGLPAPTVAQLRGMKYAEWLGILRTMYWDRWKADEIASQGVAEMLVDWVWASGRYGITIPQKVLGVGVDGIVGRKTLEAVNGADAAVLFARLRAERVAYIDRICAARPVNRKYRRGWLRRIDAIRFR